MCPDVISSYIPRYEVYVEDAFIKLVLLRETVNVIELR